MRRFLMAICFSSILFANSIDSTQNIATPQNLAKTILPQKPLIVEYDTFKEAEKSCGGSDYTKIECLVNTLRPFGNRILTKFSGSKGRFSIIFYGLDSSAKITYPRNINNRFCEFRDTLGQRYISKLKGDGFSYIIEYPFNASSSHNNAYISCGFMHYKAQIIQTSQPISVIPYSFDISFSFKDATGNIIDLNNAPLLMLKAQSNPLLIAPNATARTINGEIDRGFSENVVPLYIRFNRDNGLCEAVGEKIDGVARFKNGRLFSNSLNITFSDIASGELEIALINHLDAKDRSSGKCVESSGESTGKVQCQSPIIIKKRITLLPHSFYATIENNGRMLYYNQHTFIPAIAYLPLAKISLQALNGQNKPLSNFTKDCYGRDLSVRLEHNSENFVFINENMPDSIIPKDTFSDSSLSRIVRKISVRGIKDRDLSPLDLFSSKVINLNDTLLQIDFINTDNANYPRYQVKPKIRNDWRIALMRGRISLLPNTNTNATLIANPKIAYEFYCKYPTCKVVDIESVISPQTRLPKASAENWFINTAHWKDLKVLQHNIILGDENLSVFSLGSVKNGIQTLAIQGTQKGKFNIKISQGYNINDFAQFLYFSPSYENIREDLGVSIDINLNEGSK